jgi:hypothetical protein
MLSRPGFVIDVTRAAAKAVASPQRAASSRSRLWSDVAVSRRSRRGASEGFFRSAAKFSVEAEGDNVRSDGSAELLEASRVEDQEE